MERDWRDFKSIYGNLAGSREAFENACETLFRKQYPNKHVSQVSVKQGDGGIDIFIGELGVEPITVIQCKFFLETFEDSQKSQIRESFDRAITSEKYELKEWILCIPRVIDIDENSWWFKWKKKKNNELSKPTNFIKLINGNELIDLMKEYNIYNQIFQIEDSLKIDELHKYIIGKDRLKSSIIMLTNEVEKWFSVLGYKIEEHREVNKNSSELIINIPKRRGYDRVFILCVSEAVEINHLMDLKDKIDKYGCDEGQIITHKRISPSVRRKTGKDEYADSFCFTFDELIDADIDFSEYFKWVEDEVASKNIANNYLSLFCEKRVFDEKNQTHVDSNKYKIEEYLDQWIDDPSKHHISILGEFGTGKTWFTLHYTWLKLQEYKEAKKRGLERPRIPIFIPLRDFAKAVNIEGVFSEFFFRKHNSPIPNYDTFVELNKMGKLLLIFDGFDEMADRIDTQKMINNFWELARAITENSKVILTSRNEHFPDNKKGRELLNAELQASTQHLITEAPQFEVLELVKFNKKQIIKLLGLHTNEETIKKIKKNKNVMDLASRPIMIELILGALKDIEEGKPIDISRIYLYAIRGKFQKDIKEERTFTSISDKLYFMCELSWEMLSTDNMSINYRLFPDRIRSIFGEIVEAEKDIDHWQYDMMGQSMLIRNDDGDYRPAHRSLLEFFVAYKFAGELGILDSDFLELALKNDRTGKSSDEHYWSYYFKNVDSVKFSKFKRVNLSELKKTFGKQVITRAIIDLMTNMISIGSQDTQALFEQIIRECRGKDFEEIRYIVTNIVIILTNYQNDYFAGKDLSNLCIQGFNLPHSTSESFNYLDNKAPNFIKTNFSNSNLSESDFKNTYYMNNIDNNILGANFANANLEKFKFYSSQINSFDYLSSKKLLAIGSPDTVLILNSKDLSVFKRLDTNGWHLSFSPDGKYLVHSYWGWLYLRNTENFEIEIKHKLSEQFSETAQEKGKNLWTGDFVFSKNSKRIYLSCNNSFVYAYDIEKKEEINVYQCFEASNDVTLSYDENYLASSEYNGFNLWDLRNGELIKQEKNSNYHKVKMHPTDNILVISHNNKLRFYDILRDKFISDINVEGINNFCFASDGKTIYAASDYSIFVIDIDTKTVNNIYRVEVLDHFSRLSHESIDELVFNEDELSLYLITSSQVIVFNIAVEDVIDRYNSLYDMSGTNFISTIGLDKEVAEQLGRYGAIINTK